VCKLHTEFILTLSSVPAVESPYWLSLPTLFGDPTVPRKPSASIPNNGQPPKDDAPALRVVPAEPPPVPTPEPAAPPAPAPTPATTPPSIPTPDPAAMRTPFDPPAKSADPIGPTSGRRKLSDILRGTDRDALARQFKETEAAKDLVPLPKGEYLFRILSGELFNAKSGTGGYKLVLEVKEGEYEGRRVWHDVWLTPAALAMAKRDLAKIGVTDLDQLEQPLPPGLLIRAKVALRTNDDGVEFNRVLRFEPAGVEKVETFEPEPKAEENEPPAGGSAAPGELFPFGANGTYDPKNRR
jgi:hypothetical protein